MPPYPTQMLYCTYLGGSTGGSGYDGAWCIDLDSNNNAYITGFTECSDFPTVNPLHNYKGSNEIFASLIDPTASGSASLLDSTYIGGTGADEGAGIAVDSNDDAYVTGGTSSTDYPTLNPYQGNLAGYSDAIVTKISPSWTNNPPGQPTTPSGPTKGKTGVLYPYQTDSVYPEGHKVRYGWDWDGDSVVDEWVDNSGAYYNSGATITTNHSWASKGTYNIKVIAEDIHGAQSSWSNSLAVKIPRIRSSTFPLIIRILQRYPNIFSLLRILFIN
jgi:hypothetical protein